MMEITHHVLYFRDKHLYLYTFFLYADRDFFLCIYMFLKNEIMFLQFAFEI